MWSPDEERFMASMWRTMLLAVCLVAGTQSFAGETAPDALIKGITSDVIAAIKQDKGIQAGNMAKIDALVEARILPYFDFQRATRTAMGFNWRQATPEQRSRLTAEFRALLVRTYAGTLASYRDQLVEFRPFHMAPGDSEVTVRSQIRQSGSPAIAVEYDLERTDSGWKIFDVRVDGMSLIATYRTSFEEEVRNHGVDGLIRVLASKKRGTKPAAG
jgi:phospholipid transport system substrate-binding protein